MLLIKDAERIVFEGFLFANNYFAAVEAFPPFEIKKVIKERLQDHKAATFFTLHSISLFLPPSITNVLLHPHIRLNFNGMK